MKKVLYLALLTVFIVALAAVAAACGSNTGTAGTSTTTSSTVTSTTSQTPSNPDEVIIEEDNSFSPQTLTVPVGTKVTWFNKSPQRVYITSESKKPDTGLIAIGTRAGFTFNEPGTYNYYNLYHKEISGTIIVQ